MEQDLLFACRGAARWLMPPVNILYSSPPVMFSGGYCERWMASADLYIDEAPSLEPVVYRALSWMAPSTASWMRGWLFRLSRTPMAEMTWPEFRCIMYGMWGHCPECVQYHCYEDCPFQQ